MSKKENYFWFRRDLRIEDNAGLYHALKAKLPVTPIFIFDSNILSKLADKNDARVHFIHDALEVLNDELKTFDSALQVYYGDPNKIWKGILKDHDIDTVFTNHDFESYAIHRDNSIMKLLNEKGAKFKTFKDHIL